VTSTYGDWHLGIGYGFSLTSLFSHTLL